MADGMELSNARLLFVIPLFGTLLTYYLAEHNERA